MAHGIVVQPNGKFSIWSTVTDSFIFWNYEKEDLEEAYLKYRLEEEKRQITEGLAKMFEKVGEYNFIPNSFEEALDRMAEIGSEPSNYKKEESI